MRLRKLIVGETIIWKHLHLSLLSPASLGRRHLAAGTAQRNPIHRGSKASSPAVVSPTQGSLTQVKHHSCRYGNPVANRLALPAPGASTFDMVVLCLGGNDVLIVQHSNEHRIGTEHTGCCCCPTTSSARSARSCNMQALPSDVLPSPLNWRGGSSASLSLLI